MIQIVLLIARIIPIVHLLRLLKYNFFRKDGTEKICFKEQGKERYTKLDQNCKTSKFNVMCDEKHLNFPIEYHELSYTLNTFNNEVDNETRCQIMERIVQIIVEDELDSETLSNLVFYLSNALSMYINNDIFPVDNVNDETLTDSISSPLFVMFRNQYQLCKEDDKRKKALNTVIVELNSIQPKIGFLLIYFLMVWGNEEKNRNKEPW